MIHRIVLGKLLGDREKDGGNIKMDLKEGVCEDRRWMESV
jgi:hypothetical protein